MQSGLQVHAVGVSDRRQLQVALASWTYSIGDVMFATTREEGGIDFMMSLFESQPAGCDYWKTA